MEEIAVAGSSSLSSPSWCHHSHACTEKSRSARRRRMEIRRFKLLANTSCNKRPRHFRHQSATGCNSNPDSGEEEEEKNIESELLPPVADSIVLTSVDRDERCPPYGVVSICGGRRVMEDALRVVPSLGSGSDGVYHFFGVYDGHGGSQAAFHCKNRLHEALAEEILSTDPQTETDWKAAMKSCFLKVDGEVVGLCGKPAGPKPGLGIESQRGEPEPTDVDAARTVGSTAVVAVVATRQIVVANCGDSRAVLSRGGKAIPLSTDHKPDLPEEMERIEAAGGKVIYWDGYRVFGVLAMSRAIGDKYFKPSVIAEPELSFTERSEEDECLILASDGLWDVISNEVACDIGRRCLGLSAGGGRGGRGVEAPAAAAALLTELAVARGSADNITVIVVDLRRRSATKFNE